MIMTKQVWDSLTDDERFEAVLRAEAVRDLFPPRPGWPTSPSEWALLSNTERFARMTDVQLDLDNRQSHTLNELMQARPAEPAARSASRATRLQPATR